MEAVQKVGLDHAWAQYGNRLPKECRRYAFATVWAQQEHNICQSKLRNKLNLLLCISLTEIIPNLFFN